jgi:hypothetical protein
MDPCVGVIPAMSSEKLSWPRSIITVYRQTKAATTKKPTLKDSLYLIFSCDLRKLW